MNLESGSIQSKPIPFYYTSFIRPVMTKFNIYPLLAATILTTFAGFIICAVVVYGGVPYHINVIATHLDSGMATNSIPGKIHFMNETMNLLKNYTGNSGWLWPDELTNIDNTKQILSDSINEAVHQIPTDDKDNWMILPHPALNDYLNQQINESSQRLHTYAGAAWTNPSSSPMILLLVLIPIELITLCLIDWRINWSN